MRQENTCIERALCDSFRAMKQQQTVHQVQRNPAAGKQNENQSQRAGQPPLPEQGGLGLRTALLETALQAPEYSSIEEGHGQQGCHDTPQEVEVDHEGEGDDREEGAGRGDEGRGRCDGGIGRGGVAPAKERREPQQT